MGGRRYMAAETQWVIGWVERMSAKHGGTVIDATSGKALDWGQALCREFYGPDWAKLVEDDPTAAEVVRAQAWENGDWPDWVAR